jgi:hypothetical protein
MKFRMARIHRVGAGGQPDRTPLRTVRESFPSHDAAKASPVRMLSRDAPSRGTPAILWMNANILSPLYARPDCSSSPFAGPARGHAKQQRRSVIFLPAIFLSFPAWVQMTEKWVTEKCAKHFGSPDRGISLN